MNNFEKLQSMTDIQLSEFFASLVCHDCATTFQCSKCHPDDKGCASEILKWLKDGDNNGTLELVNNYSDN
jgi:hypothetical protein